MMIRTCKICELEKDLEAFVPSKTCRLGRSFRCNDCHKARQRENYYLSREDRINKATQYRVSNGDSYRAYQRSYNKHGKGKLANRIRNRIRYALKGITKTLSAIDCLGCSLEELKLHIESQFKPGMTWDNWSYDGWHLDHRIPLAAFDLSNPEDFKKACHYTNLQPLWAEENLTKHAKVA